MPKKTAVAAKAAPKKSTTVEIQKPKMLKDPTKTKNVLEGQKATPLELPLDRMNEKERAVLNVFNPTGPRGWYNITTLAQWAFPVENHKHAGRANSWVRNSLRRLVRGGWVEHPSKEHKGVFRLSQRAKKTLGANATETAADSVTA